MCENNSFKIDKLSFFQLDIDDGSCITNDNDLCILISLLYGNAWLSNWLIASINALGETNDTVFLS